MTSTTVRTDYVMDEHGKHQIVRTTMTVSRADERDETISPELHDSVETAAYEPEPQPSIDQAKPAPKMGRPHVDEGRSWTDSSPASKWPAEMK